MYGASFAITRLNNISFQFHDKTNGHQDLFPYSKIVRIAFAVILPTDIDTKPGTFTWANGLWCSYILMREQHITQIIYKKVKLGKQ